MSAPAAAAAAAGPRARDASSPAKCVLFLARFDPVNLSQLAVASDLALKTDASEVCFVPLGAGYDPADGPGSLARHTLLHVAVNTELAPGTPVFAPPPHAWNCCSAGVIEAVISASKARMAPRDVAFTLFAPELSADEGTPALASSALLAALSRCEGRRASLSADGDFICKLEAAPEPGDKEEGFCHRCVGRAFCPTLAPGCAVASLDISHEATACRVAALGRSMPSTSAGEGKKYSSASASTAAADAAATGRRLSVGDALAGLVPVAVASACQRYGFYSGSAGGDAQRHWAPASRSTALRVTEDIVREAMAVGAGMVGAPPKRRVAVLGGSFDPITRAHLMLAADGCLGAGVDEVWVVPCGPRPDKPGLSTHVAERLFDCVAAVEAALPASAPVFVMPLELHVPIALSTFELLCTVHSIHSGCSFELMAGADLAASLPSWRHADQLMAAARFLWVPRPGYSSGGVDDSLPSTAISGRWLVPRAGMPRVAMSMSSTQVREAAAKAAKRRGVLPSAVAAALAPLVAKPTAVRIARCRLYCAE